MKTYLLLERRTDNVRKKKSIVLISAWPPTKYHAGGQRQLDIYNFLKNEKKYKLYLYSRNTALIEDQINLSELEELFDEIFWSSFEELTAEELLNLSTFKKFDVIDVQYLNSTTDLKSLSLMTEKLIYTAMESEIRNLAISFFKFRLKKAYFKLALLEMKNVFIAQKIVSVSSIDSRYLKILVPWKVIFLDTPISEEFINFSNDTPSQNFRYRKDVIYVAYFGSQTNIESLDWYIRNVHMELIKEHPEMLLKVIGDKSELLSAKYQNCNVRCYGRVPYVAPYISKSRVAIAPALNGSGFKGKINQYSILKIPTVTHPIASRGLGYPKGSIKVSSTIAEWISSVENLYVSEYENEQQAALAQTHASNFTLQGQKDKVSQIYD